MAVNHLPVLSFASVRTDFPFLGSGSDEHFTRGGARPAQR